MMVGDVATYFWSRVEFGPDCWLWVGPSHGRYGQANFQGERMLAHRLGFEFQNGPITDGMCVLHHCDTGHCVRGEHLYEGDQADNVADMIRRGRAAWQDEDIAALAAVRRRYVQPYDGGPAS